MYDFDEMVFKKVCKHDLDSIKKFLAIDPTPTSFTVTMENTLKLRIRNWGDKVKLRMILTRMVAKVIKEGFNLKLGLVVFDDDACSMTYNLRHLPPKDLPDVNPGCVDFNIDLHRDHGQESDVDPLQSSIVAHRPSDSTVERSAVSASKMGSQEIAERAVFYQLAYMLITVRAEEPFKVSMSINTIGAPYCEFRKRTRQAMEETVHQMIRNIVSPEGYVFVLEDISFNSNTRAMILTVRNTSNDNQ